MTLGVVFRRAARGEFDAAALWYEDRQAAVFFRPEANRVVVAGLACRSHALRAWPWMTRFAPERAIQLEHLFHATMRRYRQEGWNCDPFPVLCLDLSAEPV